MAQYLLRAPHSDGETFLVFIYIWQKDVEKISKVPSASRNVNPALAITWLVGVTRASERKFSRGYEGRYRAPKSYWAPKPYRGLMP